MKIPLSKIYCVLGIGIRLEVKMYFENELVERIAGKQSCVRHKTF